MNSTSSPPQLPSSVARHMHNAPRFGHSNNLALLASLHRDDQLDYAQGVLGFCSLLWWWFLLWMIILLVLKCCCGVHRVGCAASGGRIVHIQDLKAQGIRKPQRKRLVLRSWRIQSTLMLCCVGFFVTMVCFNKLGVLPIVQVILPSLQQINSNIQTLAYQGYQVANAIQHASAPLIMNDPHNHNNNNNALSLTTLLDSHHHHDPNCSIANQIPWPLYQRTIQVGLADLSYFVNTTVQSALTGWSQVISATDTLEMIVYQIAQHVYILRAWMVVTSVVNGFLLIGVVLTMHYIIHPPLYSFLAWLILPTFMISMMGLALVIGLGGLSTIVLINADFCTGGTAPGGPVGTLLDILYRRGMQQDGFAYETIVYYLNDCVTASPFASTSLQLSGMEHVLGTITSWQQSVNKTTLATLGKSCQTDMSQALTQLDELAGDLQSIQSNLQSALSLAQCQNIYPILHQITHGPICTTSVNALTWMWSTMLVMVVLAFVIVSCRAGLYNAIVRAPPKHGRLRYQQKEFEEYKQYMAQHYQDAAEWKFDPSKEKESHDDYDHRRVLQPTETFDTAITTKPSTVASSEELTMNDDDGGCDGDVVALVPILECSEMRDSSLFYDVPLVDTTLDCASLELNATMVAEIENLGKSFDRVVKDLEALEESINRAEEEACDEDDDDDHELQLLQHQEDDMYKTPIRSQQSEHRMEKTSNQNRYSTMWSWRSRIYPNDDNDNSILDDQELRPLTPFSYKSPPMAPRKIRRNLQRTRHSHSTTMIGI